VSANEITCPTGVDTFSTDMARARSLSLNHLFAMIICELRKSELTDAIMKVPNKIGTNESWPMHANLSMAPKNEIKLATRRTWSVRNLPKRYTARKSDGGEQRANDIAHMLTVIVVERSYA
jgi:hypothetical protein